MLGSAFCEVPQWAVSQRHRPRRFQSRTSALLTVREGLSLTWEQSSSEAKLFLKLPLPLRRADVACRFSPGKLSLTLAGEKAVYGTLEEECAPDGSYWELQEEGSVLLLVLEKAQPGLWSALLEADVLSAGEADVTHRCYLDVSIAGAPPGRLELGLFADVAPKTAANFLALCTGEKGSGASGKPLHYPGTPFHRIIPRFMVQFGDTTNGDGTGGESIYGESFPDESFAILHSEPYLLSMANAGPDTNGSQAFITLVPCPHLDGKHCVFGRLLRGEEVLRAIEATGSESGDVSADVRIVASGLL